jgi:uncharacterized protein YjiS (DUF1127 family)
MATALNVFEPRQTAALVRPGLAVLTRCRDALREWRKRGKVRGRLSDLSDRELLDIGIARGEIDYVSANRAFDPRGAVLPR